jgi:multidrug efflux pump subunit AcrA (membrane-fusion protein)
MKSRRPKLLLFACVAVAGVAGGAWQWLGHGQDQGKLGPAVVRVVRRDFSSSVLATGAVKPQVGAEVRVGARISGKVQRLRANIGDVVTKGQVVAELEKADLEATVAQRQAELELARAKLAAVESMLPQEIEKAESELTRCQATLALSEQDFRRQTELLAVKGVSRDEWERSEERLKVAQAALTTARKSLELARTRYKEEQKQCTADVARADSALKNAQVVLSYATLTAPISGVIGSVSTQEGETVAVGLNAPTFVTIVDLKRLQVDAMVDEVDIGKVHPGQQAIFTVDAFPGREFKGKVVAIYPKAVLLENVVYYDVVVDILEDYENILRPEMTASVTILLESKTGVLAIPGKAVKRDRGKTVVYVLTNAQPESREVKVGWKDGPWIEVLSGLKEGQSILAEPPADKPAGIQ